MMNEQICLYIQLFTLHLKKRQIVMLHRLKIHSFIYAFLFLPGKKELNLYTIILNNVQNQLNVNPDFYACSQACLTLMPQHVSLHQVAAPCVVFLIHRPRQHPQTIYLNCPLKHR